MISDLDLLRRHRRRVGAAVFLVAWCSGMLALSLATAPAEPAAWWYIAVAVIAGIGVHAALRLPRYWRRVRETSGRLAHRAVTSQAVKGRNP